MAFLCLLVNIIYDFVNNLRNSNIISLCHTIRKLFTMKKIALSLLVILTLIACDQNKPNQFTIKGEAPGVNDGTKVFLKKIDATNNAVDVDTAEVKNHKFTLETEATTTYLTYVLVEGVNGGLPIIAEEGTATLNFEKDSIFDSKFGGTPNNNDFYTIFSKMGQINKKITKIRAEQREASQNRDTEKLQSLANTIKTEQNSLTNFEMDFAKDNPDSYVSVLILDKHSMMSKDKTDEITDAFSKLSDKQKNTDLGKALGKRLQVIKNTVVGGVLPDFKGTGLEGDSASLKANLGKVTIVDFWASWCKPCRQENPNVLKIYNEYKDKGLAIVGVSTDRNADQWKKAIQEDGITWTHMLSPETAQEFNINQIPTIFILNEKGEIVAKNLRGADLEAKVTELLNIENENVVAAM